MGRNLMNWPLYSTDLSGWRNSSINIFSLVAAVSLNAGKENY